MNVQLYNPPVHHYAGVHYKMNPALGLPILAQVLRDAGHTATVVDLEARKASPEVLRRNYLKHGAADWPDAVGFTVTTHSARGAAESIAMLRQMNYSGHIVCGGPHIMAQPEAAEELLLGAGADAVVLGEAEGNVVAIFEEQQTGVIQGEQVPIEDIPTPAWGYHFPRPKEYHGNLPKIGHPEGISMWSRGCPHQCIFCANPVYGQTPLRMRPVEAIEGEMAELSRDYGVRSVFVYDDELVGHGSRQNEWLLDASRAIQPLGLTWKCQGRCSRHVLPEVMEAMYAAGCRAIMWGVESFSNSVLEAIKKGTTETDIWHTLQTAHDAGIRNWLFLMVGNYREAPVDLAYTGQRLREAKGFGLVDFGQVTVCTPVPGTELYRLAEEEGWAVEPPEVGPQMAQVYHETPWLRKRELRLWRQRLQEAML